MGVPGFSGIAADPDGPIQQNGYSQRAGVEGGSVDFTGTAGVSLNRVGVYGQVEDSPPVPTGFRAGVLGAASTQPGVIGFSRDGDGIEGASSRAPPFAPCPSSARGAELSGALMASAAFPGRRDRRSPTRRTSPASAARRMRQTADRDIEQVHQGVGFPTTSASSAEHQPGFLRRPFAGNVQVTGTLSAAVKTPWCHSRRQQRVLHCMESPEHCLRTLAREDQGRTRGGKARCRLRQGDHARLSRIPYAGG